MLSKILTQIIIAFKTLRANLPRTILSLLGISIGVAAVVIVLSLGLGTKDYVVNQIKSFGTDLIEIEIKTPKTEQTSTQNATSMVGGQQITTLTIADAERVAKISNLGAWYGGIVNQQVISYENKNKQKMIMGVSAGVEEVDEQFNIVKGIMFSKEDDRDLKQVAIIGNEIAKDFFGKENPVGKNIKIKNQTYKIVGLLEERGGGGFIDFDNMIYLPIQTLQKKIVGINHIQFALYKIKDKNKTTLTVEEMKDVMRERHDIDDPDDEDFAVMALSEAIDMLDQVFMVVNLLLISFASISLIVGGVGITNVMYVSVTERTGEIGLRKALGARRTDILKQFLFEAMFISLAGGIIGVLIGFLTAKVGEFIVFKLGYILEFPVGFQSIIIGAGFSMAIGIIFGLRPAQKASRLSPMEALRRE